MAGTTNPAAPARSRGRAIRWGAPALGLATLVGVTALVEVLLQAGYINKFVVPPPSAVFDSVWRVITEEGILPVVDAGHREAGRFLLTCGEALAAGLMITVVGVPIGLLLRRWTLLRRATETWVAAFAAAPVVLAYPLFLVIFGRSALTIVMIGFTAGIAPVILKTLEGLSAVRPVLINVGRTYRLTGWQRFWKIEFPAAMPTIFTGIRLGLIFALINIVGVEFLINFGGLGQLINELAERYDLPGVYAAISFVVLVSIIFFVALERLETWLSPGK